MTKITKKKNTTNKATKIKNKGGRPTNKEIRYKNVGRPKAITKNHIQKLEEAFTRGYSDPQACIYADVKISTFYDYCKANPDFSDRKEELKKRIDIKAKEVMINQIEAGDKESSKWWLERKCKDEFSLRVESTGKDGKDFDFTQLKIINPSGEIKLK